MFLLIRKMLNIDQIISQPIVYSIYVHVNICIIYFYLNIKNLTPFISGKLLLILKCI